MTKPSERLQHIADNYETDRNFTASENNNYRIVHAIYETGAAICEVLEDFVSEAKKANSGD